jgi:PAP2 superfamily
MVPMERTTGAGRAWALLREFLLLTFLLGVYQAGRLLGGHDLDAAFAHARHLLQVERWLHLPAEQRVQAVLLAHDELARAANGFYRWAHLPVTGAALAWLFLRRPDAYRRTRRALVGATGIALMVYVLLPVAPPRMLPGFTDVAVQHGQSVYDTRLPVNQYAALPSLHVGWAVLIATAMVGAGRTRWRWLWPAHPLVTLFVVVGTGNHYWLDGLTGAALVLAAFAVAGSGSRDRGVVTSGADDDGPAAEPASPGGHEGSSSAASTGSPPA